MPWCAQRKGPSGGCAGAGTHLHRAASRKGTPVDLPPSPCLPPLPGRLWPAFLLNQVLASQTMQNKESEPRRQRKNGALGGRSSGRAEGHPTADAPQGAAARVAPSKKEAGRPRNKPSAVPLVRRGPDRICLDDGRALLTGDSPHDRPPEQLVLDGRREEKAAPSLLPLFAALR